MNNLSTFIDIRTDYGFKKFFGSEKNKHLLVRFLNALFGDVITINEVEFHDKEILPKDENGKRIIYDIYCTSKAQYTKKNPNDTDTCPDHHFILEMQNEYEPPFEDRVLYYTAKALSEQGSKGWEYRLEPVVSVVVTNFDFKNIKESLIHDMVVSDRVTGDILSDKLRIILLSLRQLRGRKWDECNNELEKILYLVRNMEKLNKESEAYKSGDFKEYFEAAETAYMANEDVVAYSQSLHKLHAVEAGVRYAREEAYSEGREEGIKEGIKEGRIEEQINGIRLMYSCEVPLQRIAKSYGKSINEVKAILKLQ